MVEMNYIFNKIFFNNYITKLLFFYKIFFIRIGDFYKNLVHYICSTMWTRKGLKPIFVIFWFCCNFYAQDKKTDNYKDSLQNIIDININKVKTKEALFLLGEHLSERNPELALDIAQNLKSNYISIKDSNGIIRNNYIFTEVYRSKGDYLTAISYSDSIYSYSKKHNDSLNIAKSAGLSGILHTDLGNNIKSHKKLIEAAEIYDRIGTTNQKATIYSNLAILYINTKQLKKGEQTYFEALKHFEILNDSAGIANVNANLGLFYTEIGEFKKAEYHLKKQKDYNKVHPTLREMAYHYDFLGYLRLKEGKLENAHKEILKSLKIRENLSNSYNVCESKLSLAEVLIKLKKNTEAIKHLKDVVNLSNSKHQSIHHQEYAYELLTDAYEKKGDYKNAFVNLEKYNIAHDSLFSKESMLIIAEKEAKYNQQKKDAKIALLNKEKEISKYEVSRSKNIAIVSLIVLLLILIGAITLYKLYSKINQKNKIITKALKDRELLLHETHHRVKNNLQMISSLLNLQSKHIKDKKVFEVLQNGRNRVQSMAILHKNLYTGEELDMVNIQSYFENLVKNILDSYKKTTDEVTIYIEAKDIILNMESVVSIGLIINELVTNSLKHAFIDSKNDKPEIIVKMNENKANYSLLVKDNGIGIDSLKVNDKAESFGQKLIRLFTNKLKAEVIINNKNGTEVIITFPK